VLHPRITADWEGKPCIVMASGPSLTPEVARKVRFVRWLEGWKVIVVNDAYKMLPRADILYACDERWWDLHQGAKEFEGERWSSHNASPRVKDEKIVCAERFGLNLVLAEDGEGFSFNQSFIRYGGSSGGQAINLALLKGCRRIVLVGFDQRLVSGKSHFFGSHPEPLHDMQDDDFRGSLLDFKYAAQSLPADVSIVNATPGSALTIFPMMEFDEATRWDDRLHRHRAEPECRAHRDCTA